MWILRFFLLLSAAVIFSDANAASASEKPNIIVILVDDMGFSDLGCYGSEIPTPNLDNLAASGVKFSQFYNTGRCCPTRGALLTGLYSHQAGIGWMSTDFGTNYPGYRGRLIEDRITIPEVVKSAGYFTAMTGKWHLGQGPNTPAERFDRSLQAMAGGFYYPDSTSGPRLVLNGKRVQPNGPELPVKWYSTDLWTDFGLRFIDDALKEKKPFFLYLAHNAPHFPLQADPEDVAKFRGKYKAGWDKLSADRHHRQIASGLIDKTWQKAARPSSVTAWDALSEADKDHFDNLMAIYAACVWRMDLSIGALVDGLKQRGVFDNTVIFFMSDNGGNAEGGYRGISRGPGEPGRPNSTVFCGESWAWMENTPLRKFKHYNHEGGIATPLIVHWPAGIQPRKEWCTEPAHLIDILPTCMDLGGATMPASYRGNQTLNPEGISLKPLFSGKQVSRSEPIFWEHEGNAAVRQGKWKISRLGYKGKWELYDMSADRTEQHDLGEKNPELLKSMAAKWDAWAERANVKPWPDGIGYPRTEAAPGTKGKRKKK